MIEREKQDRIAVYTVIIGNYDVLRRPKCVDENCDYYCFTDSDQLTSDFWQIRLLPNPEGLDNARLSRLPKLMPHKFFPEYGASFYLDPNIEIRLSVNEFIAAYSTGKPMLCMKHSARDCIYDEALECIRLEKDKADIIEAQMLRFRDEGFPEHYGLTQNSMLYRAHNDETVIRVMEQWWEIVKNGSRRDQLSLSYACWKQQFPYDVANEDWLNCIYFKRYAHLSEAYVFPRSPVGSVVFHTSNAQTPTLVERSTSPLISMLQNYPTFDKSKPLPLTYRFEDNFYCPANVTGAEFRPIENHFCMVTDLRVYMNQVEVSTEPINGFSTGQVFCFPTIAPSIRLNIPEHASGTINISAVIQIFQHMEDWELINAAYEDHPATIQSRKLHEEYQHLLQNYLTIENSTIWRLTKPLRKTLDTIKNFARSRVLPAFRRLRKNTNPKQV